MRLWTATFLILVGFAPAAAVAEYIVTSKVEGWFCSGFLIQRCGLEEIDAFSRSEKGQLFEFSERFDRVDDFSASQSRCWLENRGGEFHGFARKANGDFEYLGQPDNVTFKCQRVR